MLFSREYRRSISIGFAMTSLTLITILYVSFPMNKYYTDFQKYQYRVIRDHDRSSSMRIFCLILTSPKYLLTRAKAVNETWAPRCDRYFFVTESLADNVSSELMNFTKRLPIAPIQNIISGYDHLTQKSNVAFLFAYENYLNDYDWFVKADDDTYLFVDHLRTFLSDKNASEPVTYGYNFKVNVDKGYHSGGGSYVLSRESIRRFHQAYHESPSQCRKDGGSEDVEVARCLRSQGVYPGKSLDKQNRELFHPLPFDAHFRGHFPDWLTVYAENQPRKHYDCCSDQTISFHYVSPDEQYMMDFLVYRVGAASKVQ